MTYFHPFNLSITEVLFLETADSRSCFLSIVTIAYFIGVFKPFTINEINGIFDLFSVHPVFHFSVSPFLPILGLFEHF